MDHNVNLYFREIVYHSPSGKKDSVCGVFSYEAINIEQAKLGNLYLVGKIANFPQKKHKNFDFLLNLLSSAIKREFYSDPERNTLEALESALQSANIYLTDFAKKGHKEWIGNLDFTCIAFSGNNMHVGQTGDMLIYLLRGSTMSNIARKFSTKEKKKVPLKTFSNIASGNLEENDRIVVSTSDILSLASAQKIKDLISYPSSEELYNYLKENLEEKSKAKEKEPNALACLILEARIKPPVITVKKEIPKSEEKPSITIVDLERVLNSKANKFNNVIKSKVSENSKLSRFTPVLRYNVVKYLVAFLVFLLIILSPYIVQKIGYDSKIKQVNNLIKRTEEVISKSEILLAYQNQFEAQSLLTQANALIANASSILSQLPEQVKTESAQDLKSIEQSLNGQKNSINNVVNIEQPEEITDLSRNSFSFNPRGILKLENTLYLYELTSGFLYEINLNDIENPTLVFLSSKDTFKLGTVRDNAIVLLSSPEKIYLYSNNDNYNTYLLKPSLENTLYIKDVDQYKGNLYFLDTERLNILKYTAQETSLTGEDWINENYKEDLIDAQSIAIDGSIYISKANGMIVEFIKGNKVKEFKPNVSPELNNSGQIFTTPEMRNLYILDPKNNRIVAYNKNDGLSTQYVSNEFGILTDLWVTPDERTMYLLNGLKVYRIDI